MPTRRPFAALKSPQALNLFYRAVGMLFGAMLAWMLLIAILSLINAWVMVLLTCGLGAAVYVRDRRARQQDAWIQQGRCGGCGYDLPVPPAKCPHCGRDGAADEPAWRKLRREHASRKTAEIAGKAAGVSSEPIPVIPLPRPIRRRPPVDDSPIPLEPLNPPPDPRDG